MPGKNKTPLLGWHPASVELAAWARAEAKRRDVPLARVLDEALTAYRQSAEAVTASPEPRTAVTATTRKPRPKPAAKESAPAKCAHRFVLKGWCKDCREYVGQKSPGRQVKA